jgi:methylated-DNA-[protein]-cysteine S-methyltransferase
MYYTTRCSSPVGPLTLAGDGYSLSGLWMDGQKYFAATLPETAVEKDDLPLFDVVKEWLDRYFAGERPEHAHLPLSPAGSPFRQRVWAILRTIPSGGLMTYGEIAGQVARNTGQPRCSAQAVGGAVGHNPISIIIPCHRVVGADGNLTGYAGGIDKKVKLLEREGVEMSRLFVPKKGTAL